MKYNFDEIINRENTDSYKYDLREHYFGTKDVLPMWVADMDFRTPDFIIDAVKKRAEHPLYGYSIRSSSFNDSIVSWMQRRFSWEIQSTRIAFSPGVVPAINMCIMAYSEPGDKIIVQPPVYFPFYSAITKNNRHILYNPLKIINGRLCMDLDNLRENIDEKTKMILLCTPHNPGGSVWTQAELIELCNICLENNILIVSDEIHSDLVFKPHKHTPTATLSKEIEDSTVTCISPSKTFNTAGFSTSALIIPKRKLLSMYIKVLEQVHVGSGSLFGHVALEAAYNHGEEWLEQLLDYLQGNIDYAIEYMQTNIPQIKPIRPEATYMIWLDCRNMGITAEEQKEFFIKKARIGFSEGVLFGPGGEGFQRMNIACPRPVLKEALDRINKALKKL